MSTSKAGSAGFKNIRAMFENKANDTSQSPPSRGRSPNEPTSPSKERPLSKVRANFVAVDKAIEEPQFQSLPSNLHSTMDGSSDVTVSDENGLGGILKGSPFVDDRAVRSEDESQSDSQDVEDQAASMVKRMSQEDIQPPPVGNFVDSSHTPRAMPIGPAHPKPEEKPTLIQQSGAEMSPAHSKGPMLKPRGGGPKVLGILESSRQAREADQVSGTETKPVEHTITESGTRTANDVQQEKTSVDRGSNSKTNPLKLLQAPNSNNKPKEQRAAGMDPVSKPPATTASTTIKPARSSLPSRKVQSIAAAPTGSSTAKVDESKVVNSKPTEQKPSKLPPRVANATTTSSLAKKSSRASLNSGDGAKSKPSTRPADEGFLARMMRPTASSAQKAHEKLHPPSPPRAKHVAVKTLSIKPSRRSLNSTSGNKENESSNPVGSDMQVQTDHEKSSCTTSAG